MQKFSNGWNDLQNYSWPMGQVLFGRPHTVILYSILIMSLSRTISEIQPCHEHSFQLNMTVELVATCNAELSITVRTMYVIYAYFYILALAWYLLTEMTFKDHSRSSTMYHRNYVPVLFLRYSDNWSKLATANFSYPSIFCGHNEGDLTGIPSGFQAKRKAN